MRRIDVNVDLNDFKRMMSKYLKGITFDEVSWETGTDSEGKVCYTTTVDILPLKTFSITDKKDKDYYFNLLTDACGKEIDELRNKLSAGRCTIDIKNGKFVFESSKEPTSKKVGINNLDYIMPTCIGVVDRTLKEVNDICFNNGDIYYINIAFRPIQDFFLDNQRYTLDLEMNIKKRYGKTFLEIAKKYGFEDYIFDLRFGAIRFYSTELPQGRHSVGDEDDYFDYPSQRSAVAQQVANQYQEQ